MYNAEKLATLDTQDTRRR